MIPRKSANSMQSAEKRAKVQLKQSNSHRIKPESPRPHVGIQWNDVKSGFKHFKIKRWNSIGSWVVKVGNSVCGSARTSATWVTLQHNSSRKSGNRFSRVQNRVRAKWDTTAAHLRAVLQTRASSMSHLSNQINWTKLNALWFKNITDVLNSRALIPVEER